MLYLCFQTKNFKRKEIHYTSLSLQIPSLGNYERTESTVEMTTGVLIILKKSRLGN